MGAVKTFKIKGEVPPEHLHFEIEFEPAEGLDEEPRVEEFEAYGKAHAGMTLALASVARYDLRGRQVPDMNGMMRFFELAMPAPDYERFRTLIDSPDWQVELDTVGDIFSWLIEETADRPTRRSRRSSRMRQAGGRTEPGAVIELHDDSVAETSLS